MGSIKYFGFIFRKLIFHKDFLSWRIDTFRICYASRIFSFFVFAVLSRYICLLLLWELWKSKTCNYCLLPVIRLLWKYCLGRNSFQIFQVDHFSEKNLYISADLCNPCIIMYEILYITLLWYVLQLLYFICCAQISKTITWAYFSNYLSELPRTKLLCFLWEIFADRTVMLYCLGHFLAIDYHNLCFP